MRHPVSTPCRFEHELSAAMLFRVVEYAVGPGTPDDAQPSATEDVHSKRVIAASGPGLCVDACGPGIGVTRVVGHAGQRCAQAVVAGPAEPDGL